MGSRSGEIKPWLWEECYESVTSLVVERSRGLVTVVEASGDRCCIDERIACDWLMYMFVILACM